MSNCPKSVTRQTAPAVVPPVTPSTMPASFKVSADTVVVPTLETRVRRAQDMVTLVQFALLYRQLTDRGEIDQHVVNEIVGHIPDGSDGVEVAGRALSDAIGELYWVLAHPEPDVLKLRVPTLEDWECFQNEQSKRAEGGAR